MRLVLSILLTVLLGSSAIADETKVERIDIVGKGIYQLELGASIPKADVPGGVVTPPAKFTQIESTTTVPARIGVEFGLEYKIIGEPDGTEITLEFVDTYPDPGLADPEKSAPFQTSRYERTRPIGETLYTGYGFEHEWELVPGTWTFEIWYDGRKLAAEQFTVVE